MNFDQWWATLTPREQKIIGEHNARFVWQEAVFHTVGELDLSKYEDCPVCRQEIGRAHVWTPVTDQSRMPSSA